jgi:bifunctional non-homologous end joining protein LigD
MSLSLYKKKRKFSETPEPEGKEKSSAKGLRFVIQKHDASHLHYDFRLEMKGVLKSWAVPKGPSLNPNDKRLAMMVEDHPYDYRTFEGVIPEGNYGGGTVIVWDEGTYELMNGEGLDKKEQEKLLLKQLYAGDLKLLMHGKKIKGTYALFRLKKEEKSWLLVKKSDEFASEEEVIKQNKSVKSGKTLAQVAKQNGVEVKHPEEDTPADKKTKSPGIKKIGAKSNPVKKVASVKKTATAKKKVLT